MKRFYVIGFLVLLGFDTLGQVGFKLAAVGAAPPGLDLAWLGRIASERWIYFAVAGYLGAFVTWMTLLEHAPIGPAFAVSHLEIVTVLLVSVTLFGETLSGTQVVGGGLILAGIGLIARSGPERLRAAPRGEDERAAELAGAHR